MRLVGYGREITLEREKLPLLFPLLARSKIHSFLHRTRTNDMPMKEARTFVWAGNFGHSFPSSLSFCHLRCFRHAPFTSSNAFSFVTAWSMELSQVCFSPVQSGRRKRVLHEQVARAWSLSVLWSPQMPHRPLWVCVYLCSFETSVHSARSVTGPNWLRVRAACVALFYIWRTCSRQLSLTLLSLANCGGIHLSSSTTSLLLHYATQCSLVLRVSWRRDTHRDIHKLSLSPHLATRALAARECTLQFSL